MRLYAHGSGGTTGFQAQAQAGMDAEMFHNPVVGHRRFAHRMHRHMGTFCRMTTDRLFHCATGSHVADGHRFILMSDLASAAATPPAGFVPEWFSPPPSDRLVSLSRRCTIPRAAHRHRRIVVAAHSAQYRQGCPRQDATTRSRGLLITRMSSSS